MIPTTNHLRLKYLLSSLERQTQRPHEVIIVYKGDHLNYVEDISSRIPLKCNIIEQKKGNFTRALNMCIREARGDLAVFTDDDAIALPRWIENYIKLHSFYGNDVACISSRDIYLDLEKMRIVRTPDDYLHVKLFRRFVRPHLERPHPLLKRYRFGLYLTKNYSVAHGPHIPDKHCLSLPFRGVNMSFKKEVLDHVRFPEHPLLVRAPGNEQYVGLQLIIKGYESVYVPNNPILHIVHESLSRTKSKQIKIERIIMKSLYFTLINNYTKQNRI
jgi:glycosyltransferase involved in cell wall biosynthesis